MLSALWLVSVAHAGEIQVLTRTPVLVVVDGQILQYPEGSTTVTASDLAGGAHLVEVRSVIGKPIVSTTIDVPVNQQVRLQYAERTITVLGSGMLPRDTTPPPPPPPPEPPKRLAMSEAQFTPLLASVQRARFSSDKLEVLRSATSSNWFTCTQVAALLGAFDFDNDRVDAVRLLAPDVVDRQNAEVIRGAFQFQSNANEAMALFR